MRLLAFVLPALLATFATPVLARAPVPVIIVSIDGFRWDYLDRGVSPNLSALAANGVRARRMVPSFPSVTFPNHYTLVTGLYPDHHGIVNNSFEDPQTHAVFTMASKEVDWWNGATPIWTTAELNGIHAGIMFWPGSEEVLKGVRPSEVRAYDHSVTPTTRVDTVLGWLDLPADKRPGFIALYFEPVDGAGHTYGPDSPQVNEAIGTIDAAVGRLVTGLKARGIAANLIIVADHGMAPVGPDNRVVLDNLIDLSAVHVVFAGTVVGIDIPDTPAGHAAEAKLLAPQPHLTCWHKADVPAALHYGTNPRVPAIVCSVQTGWLAETREGLAREVAQHRTVERGAHGYDNRDPLMGALFIANGPAFREGLVIDPFPNVDVYPLMAHLLGVPPQGNDGHLSDLAPILKPADRAR